MTQLFNQAIIRNPNNELPNPAVFRTETQDMQIETKNINVTCPYLAGIISVLRTFLRSQPEKPSIFYKETRYQ